MSDATLPSQKSPNTIVDDRELYLCFRLMKSKDFDGAAERIEMGLQKARSEKNLPSEGLYLSAFGVLHKLKNDFKESYKYYQQAERLLPDDPSLKIISSTLLISEFKQYDTAIRKLKKILEVDPQDPAFVHHALALLSIAYFSSAQKPLAKETFETLLSENFARLGSAANINYKVVEFFIAKNFELETCKKFLTKALAVAETRREIGYKNVIVALIGQI